MVMILYLWCSLNKISSLTKGCFFKKESLLSSVCVCVCVCVFIYPGFVTKNSSLFPEKEIYLEKLYHEEGHC